MGGGVGLSMHSKLRVATEKTVWSMPESSIGFFADVGTSFLLTHFNNNSLGLYLALVGEVVPGEDA